MHSTVSDSLFSNVTIERRRLAQEEFGRHLIAARNRMAKTVLLRLETGGAHPIPLIERRLAPIRFMNSEQLAAVKCAVLDGADEIVKAMLMLFAAGNDTIAHDGNVANYAIVVQARSPDSDVVKESIDINRGEPLCVLWNEYKKWLSRYAPSELR